MPSATLDDSLGIVRRIMQRRGVCAAASDFHAAVNVTFHEFEAEHYDEEHRDMWASLPRQFCLLVGDSMEAHRDLQGDLRMLDIGCGTGLASECVLGTALGDRIRSIDLLDTSPAMLTLAAKRAQHWKVPVARYEGLLDTIPAGKQYDLVVTCSVLHHIPDVPGFLAGVRRLQALGGIFLHLQDPNGDYLKDPELRQRMADVAKSVVPEALKRFTPKRILGRLQRQLTGRQDEDCVSKTNRSLLEAGWIQTPLTVHEIYSITDIHVDDGEGISIRRMQEVMSDYECVSQRSYGFFGRLCSTLPPHLQLQEEDLIARRAPNGFHTGAIWRRR